MVKQKGGSVEGGREGSVKGGREGSVEGRWGLSYQMFPVIEAGLELRMFLPCTTICSGAIQRIGHARCFGSRE